MLKRKVNKIGAHGSLYIVIPRQYCSMVGIQKGDEVEFRLDGNRIYFRRC